ncbi:MAG: lipocalin family protein [Treponema sp.]|jgi:hypothetical protein|nr:lipocalin family protein [Treponema sp.]
MKTKHGVLIGFAVLLIAAMFTVAGCGDSGSGDPTTPPGDGGGGDLSGTGLALPTGYVWLPNKISEEEGRGWSDGSAAYAFVFHTNGTYSAYDFDDDETITYDYVMDATCSVSGNTLTLEYMGAVTFSLSGDTLTLTEQRGHTCTLTKTQM